MLFSGSVRDNIAYGLKSCSDEKVMAAARAARAEEFINEMEHGLYTGTCSQRRTWSLFGRAGCGAVGGGCGEGLVPVTRCSRFPFLTSHLPSSPTIRKEFFSLLSAQVPLFPESRREVVLPPSPPESPSSPPSRNRALIFRTRACGHTTCALVPVVITCV